MARHTNPEYKKDDLIKMVVEWTGKGITRARQVRNIEDLGYGIDYAYQVLRDAKPLINELLKDIGKDMFEQTIAELDRMKLQAENAGDLALANNIFKERNRIIGLYQDRIDLTTNGNAIENISVIKLVEVNKENNQNQE